MTRVAAIMRSSPPLHLCQFCVMAPPSVYRIHRGCIGNRSHTSTRTSALISSTD
jgi:hypothetical protein